MAAKLDLCDLLTLKKVKYSNVIAYFYYPKHIALIIQAG